MDNTEQSSFSELEKPPTLVAEFGSEKISGGSGSDQETNVIMPSGEDKSAKMPVLQPNVGGMATRTKSGRIHKPARNFNSDEYVVPTLVKRRLPGNARPSLPKEKEKVKVAPVLSTATTAASEIDLIRSRLEQRFPEAALQEDVEPSLQFVTSICFKEPERSENMSAVDIHTRVKNIYKNWTKGPYRLKEDEVKFIQECIVKAECLRIPAKEWYILAEVLRDRSNRMNKRHSRPGRHPKKRTEDTMKKSFSDIGNKIMKGKQSATCDSDVDYEVNSDDLEDAEEDMDIDNSSTHSSRLSTRSKDVSASKTRGGSSKTPSVSNNENEDYDLGPVGIDDFAGEEEMFDVLDSELVNESKDKVGNGNSMVAELHASLQNRKGSDFDPDGPPALDKDAIYGLDDMEGAENFFENMEEAPNFGDDGIPQGDMTDEALAELEQQVLEDEENAQQDSDENSMDAQPTTSSGRRSILERKPKLDLSTLEIEESSGNVRPSSGAAPGDINPGVTMISTKTALMCALKISEDFLPSSHEQYLNRLEHTDKYRHNELNDIRRMFNMKPTSLIAAKRKMRLDSSDSTSSNKRLKVLNGSASTVPPPSLDKPKSGMPYLRSAYAKCRKFMEDETTAIEKLGNNKILAAGRIIEVDYENYTKESDVKIPYDETVDQIPKLLPPSVSNCHAPPCRLGCICSSISEDMPPRKHCGRPRCFFECTCQQLMMNSSDDGDIRSRLRPRVSLLNWRAESTEKEKEPMTSYRQMERGTHFIRVRRTAVSSDRLRRDFVLDGKIVDRVAVKNTKERLSHRTKALLHSSHRRIMGKHSHVTFVTNPGAPRPEVKPKPRITVEQLKKKCTPMTIDVDHLDIEITPVHPQPPPPPPLRKQSFFVRKEPVPKMAVKEIDAMKAIVKEMTEDCQLMAISGKIGFFSWSVGVVQPKVIMYQVEKGDEFRVPWLYLPIPPQGYSWICHTLGSCFEKSDYVYIPEIKCTLSSQALRVNMNTAFIRKKGVVFDVNATGHSPGIGKIYFFPDLPKVLICGPFRTDPTTVIPDDPGNAEGIGSALEHLEHLRRMKRFGSDQSWKTFTASPTIFPIKKRNDNESPLHGTKSRKLFTQLLPSLMQSASIKALGKVSTLAPPPAPPKPAFAGGWSNAMNFVGYAGEQQQSLTEVVTLM